MNQSRPCTDKHAQSSSAEFCKESFLFMPVSISYVLGIGKAKQRCVLSSPIANKER